ncbi:PglZ domain-containing protein [Coleofasciculus sp. FACHB-712]|uniref:PglZ domain-containing protein n=1 Tax=Coleofasciculus sp. FACHB-712 TaxID=2692789 RepID=UPI001686EE3C|nr:PglZ domain-containing protein [Coleofasciculus sp. FACHB-712]
MGIVTDYLHNLIAKQVEDHGIVVWYDPECHYTDIVPSLKIPNTTVTSYKDSFFALRHEVNSLLDINRLTPPKLVIYVPLDPTDTHNALVELEAAGVIMRPGQQPPIRNTKLSVIARNALKPILGDETTAAIEKQVEAGKLTLTDLNAIAEKGEGITQGVVLTIFGTGNPQEVALAFLESDRFDTDIINKGANQELAVLLQSAFEVELPSDEPPSDYRIRLARRILTTDLISNLKGEIPTQLSGVKTPSKPATRDACIHLARIWRLQRNLVESYIDRANQVEKELGLTGIDFSREQIADAETFLAVERALQRNVELALLSAPTDELVEIAQRRKSSFWSEYQDVQAHWSLIAVAGQLLLEANRIEKELKSSAVDVQIIFRAYTATEAPWCLLDTYHRQMERRWHDFEFSLHKRHENLEQLVNHARNRYMTVGSQLAETFVRRYQAAKFRLPGILRQTEVFFKAVKPKLAEGKTAYVWVDALRYEMARELAQTLTEDYTLEIQPAIAAVPTITEIGMAAFLPGAVESATVVAAGESKLGLEINGTVLKDRSGRIKFLQENAGVPVFATKLGDLLPNPKKKEREGIEKAKLILVTSQEIDAIGEGDNVRLARRIMDDILHELRRVFRVLSDLGVETIIFAADHGYLFGEELSDDQKIAAPGGETADLHRRVWVGRGGTADAAYLRAKLTDFGLGGDLEIATPWNLSCFKVKGGTEAYFHGGLSPQELIIPVVTLTPKQKLTVGLFSEVDWEIKPSKPKITNRFFSVQIQGTATSLFELIPPKVRVEVRVKKECISRPVSASYGFEDATGDVQLTLCADGSRAIESNTVTLMIAETEPSKKEVSIHLLDAITGAELARIAKIEMAIAI